jgi:hypothetical protein
MDLVHKEGLHWRTWADQNLQRPDGSQWSHHTLYTYASYGRDQTKLAASRNSIARLGREARLALSNSKALDHRVSANDLDRQLAALMFAWNGASLEARRIFLDKINKKG